MRKLKDRITRMLEGMWKWIIQSRKLIMLFLKPPKEYEGLCRVRIVTGFAALAVSGFGVCGFLCLSSVEGRVYFVILLLVAGIMSLFLIPIRILKRDTYRKVLDEKEEDGGIDENYLPNPDMAPEQVRARNWGKLIGEYVLLLGGIALFSWIIDIPNSPEQVSVPSWLTLFILHCISCLKEFLCSIPYLKDCLVLLLGVVAIVLFIASFITLVQGKFKTAACHLSCFIFMCLLLTGIFCLFNGEREVVCAFIWLLAGMSLLEVLLMVRAAWCENNNLRIWRSEKASEIGARMIVYPALFIFLGVLAQRMQGMQDLVGEKGDLGKAMIALTILTYPVELWNVFLDVIKSDGKEAVSRNSALETSLDGLRKEMQRTSETMGSLVESQQRMSQCMESMEKAFGLAETMPGISCRRTESLYEIKMVLRRRKHDVN
ncbi:hypothetical protein [Bifidobacterium moukalabense]|uniref:hypothetical protein n=1 Tax=Bifidobacterium moukalabense TaxID=1333651 RepID=UPI0010F94E6D|nr:hypothetical protein [Bifidobacterium moukalabense]